MSTRTFPVTRKVSQPPSCAVRDVYSVGHLEATLTRTIEYRNRGSSPTPVAFNSKTLCFPPDYTDFECFVNGEPVEHNEDPRSQQVELRILLKQHQLEPQASITAKIVCRCRRFSSNLQDCRIAFEYPDTGTYELVLEGFSPRDRMYAIHKDGVVMREGKDFTVTPNSIAFNPTEMSFSHPVAIEMLCLSTPAELPVLSTFETGETSFSGNIVVLVQHLLSDFVHLAAAFERGGVRPEHMLIIGIPYSTKEQTRRYLSLNGYPRVETPAEYPFDEVVADSIAQAIGLSEATGKQVLVVEDGGYVVPLLHSRFPDAAPRFIGAVEQTANGIWRDRDAIKQARTGCLLPIINVAESRIKDKLESPLIGKAVCRNIELLLGREGHAVEGKLVALAGFGRTGSMIAKMLRASGARVRVYDSDGIQNAQAKQDGYEVVSDVSQLLPGAGVIVEATGDIWCTGDAIGQIEDGTYFVNASSKRLGMDYSALEQSVDLAARVNVPGIGVRHTTRAGRTLTLLADGYPVNFFLGESVPDRQIAFILAMLFGSARYLVESDPEALPKEIIDMNRVDSDKALSELQQKVSEVHLRYS